MEISNNNWYAMSDSAVLEELGTYIQQTRLQQNKTQQQLAEAAGVNRSTVVQFESGGGGTLLTFIQLLRALQQLPLLQQFEQKQELSPLQLAKLEHKTRKRARNNSADETGKPKSDW